MADYSEFYRARNIINDILEKDLVGPVYDDEVLVEIPVSYYVMGKLYPPKDQTETEDMARNPFLETGTESYDASISLTNQLNPSSMGITCTLIPDTKEILVSGEYSFYSPTPSVQADQDVLERAGRQGNLKDRDLLWVRKEVSYSEQIVFDEENPKKIPVEHGMELHVYTHAVYPNGERVITVVLVNNNNSAPDLTDTSLNTAFQPRIRVSSCNGESVFTEATREIRMSEDPEILELEMLYSDVICYAQGHGCAVSWDLDNEIPFWVQTEFLPQHELLQMKAASHGDPEIFSMEYLSTASPEMVLDGLSRLTDEYEDWIKEIREKSRTFPDFRLTVADSNIKKCTDACNRIKNTIRLLRTSANGDALAYRAFQYANEAMLLQRERTVLKEGKPFDRKTVKWYPFQIAFILHEIGGMIDPSLPERNEVDLLWFPTGGGKTEAYLGITAFTIFLRRLRDSNADGVTVMMRYTLRLLTLQQFERASMLIFACELIRRKYRLGGSEISIGLWVGSKLTPNSIEDARTGVRKKQRGADISGEKSDPCQIKKCPWCGEPILPKDYSVDIERKRMYIKCSNQSCDIHSLPEGMPLHIIDAAIYTHLPTFIVATVDKFARIPLDDKPARLFGITSEKKPPELIIQDELHLISGPLGTMTGIYEAAITKLCQSDGINAKIIASTATIRNAASQIKALYGRKHTQFPPQGITAKNSFFAEQSSPEERPARRYLGVMGIGATATTTLIRVNAALLFASRYIELEKNGFPDNVIDNFWTITGYFNSLRELGGAATQILDDVQSRFSYLAKSKFGHLYSGTDPDAAYDQVEELTSRMDNNKITDVIQVRLNNAYTRNNHIGVYDFLLASNMISVGVDVSRLGTMVVAGQPKANAEYIQATSRVGRSNPGLVVTVYNASKSRDRSHYEQFQKYHSALYRYVEATSLTPFSDRARDRGLHALYVSLCRYLVDNLRGNADAINYDPDDPEVKKVEEYIKEYISVVDASELKSAEDELCDIKTEWDIEAAGSLEYKSYRGDRDLLKSDDSDSRFRTMNSMRNVDRECGIYLMRR